MMATTGGRSAATEKRRLRETPGKDGARMSIPDSGPGLGLDGAADAGISPDAGQRQVDVTEAARQLQQAAHDATVAYDCIGLGELARRSEERRVGKECRARWSRDQYKK